MANRPGNNDQALRPPPASSNGNPPASSTAPESIESFRTARGSTDLESYASGISSDIVNNPPVPPTSPTSAPPHALPPTRQQIEPESSIDKTASSVVDHHRAGNDPDYDREPPAAGWRKKKLTKRKPAPRSNDKESSNSSDTVRPRPKPKPPPIITPIDTVSETSLLSESLVKEVRLSLPTEEDLAARLGGRNQNIDELLETDLGRARTEEDGGERPADSLQTQRGEPATASSPKDGRPRSAPDQTDGVSLAAGIPRRQEDQAVRPSPNSILDKAKSKHNTKILSFEDRLQTNLQKGSAFIYMVIPPDGGYGWFIVLISFLCQVIVDGIIFSIGITLPYIAKDMGVTPAEVILVASAQIGPISSAFINKYGFRPVAFAGAIIAIVVIFIATLTTNLTEMIIFYSVLGGPALSMVWVSSQLIIGYYFEKYRPIANGVSCSGAGAGILLFSYMNSRIVPTIGWRNTSRVHIGFLLTVLLMAITYIEVTPTRIARVHEPDLESDSEEYEHIEFLRSFRYSRAVTTFPSETTTMDHGLEKMLEKYEVPQKKPSRLRSWCRKCCCIRETVSDTEIGEFETKRYVIRSDPMEKQDLFYMGPADYVDESAENQKIDGKSIEMLTKRAKTVHYTLSVMHATRGPESTRRTIHELRLTHKYPVLAYLSPKNWVHPKIRRALSMLFDLNMLRIMEFQVLCASAFFFPMGFNIPFVYSKERVQIDPFHAAMISPAIGFSNLVFRIISGFAAYKYRHHTTYICGYGIIFGGVFVLISAFYGIDKVWFQYVYALCYGVAPAFYSTLRAIIYVRALGLDKLTNAFGLTAMAMGMGVFVGTTLAATMNEQTGSYTMAFAFSGICLITAGMLKVLLPTLIVWKERREKRANKK